MASLSAIGANLFLLVAAWGYGCSLERWLPQSFSFLDRLAFSLLGGLGLTGTLLFVVGQLWFSKAAILLTLLPGVILGLKALPSVIKGISAKPILDRKSALPAAIVLIVLSTAAIGGLAEPVGDIRMDAIAYHFLGPKVWVQEKLIRPVPDESLTAFPAIVETQYAALMAVGGQRAPTFFATIAFGSLILLLFSLASRSGLNPSYVLWVGAIVLTMPVVYRGGYGGFVDVTYSSFVLAAARLAFDARSPVHYAVCGAFCGFAMGTKYTGVIATGLVLISAFVPTTRLQALGADRRSKNMGILCGAALLFASPWYLRNWIVLGCPIYPPPPFLLRFFTVRYFPADALHQLAARIWREGQGMGRNLTDLALLPFHLTYHPANFINGAGGIGLTPLALAPFGLVRCWRDAFLRFLAIFASLQTLVWFVSAQEARYLIHGYVIAGIFAAWGWSYVKRVSPRWGAVCAGVIVGVSVLYGMAMICSARGDDVRAALSASFNSSRRSVEIPFVGAFEYLNRESSVTKVIILSPRVPPYYLDKPYVKPLGRLGEQVLAPNWRDQLLPELKRLHISDVLDVRSEDDDFKLKDLVGLQLVLEEKDTRIYRVLN